MAFFNNTNSSLLYNSEILTSRNLTCYTTRRNFDHIESMEGIYMVCNIFNTVLALIAVFANALIMLVIWRSPPLYTPSFVLLFNLALSDFGVGALALPPFVIKKFVEIQLFKIDRGSEAWYSALAIYCKSGLTADVFGTLFAVSSYFFLVAISMERCLAIHLHLRYNQIVTIRRTITASVFLWLFATSLVTFRLLLDLRTVIKVFSFLVLTIVIVIYANVKIAVTLRRHTMQIRSQALPGNFTSVGISKFKKSMITLCLIFFLFVICYVPFLITAIGYASYVPDYIYLALSAVSTSIVYLNSALNPMVYCMRIGEIREGVRAAFGIGSRRVANSCTV
ncbi:predicted protein [Nematostella vectensis]|uniref:G-protein coupled receptors family 1 profile domain-containing protein n=1 Tax=Nematostella vectensis TaxID=45351 RepID=A7RQC6_NEMVE|nr:predicted protein [Nematostella vectensis]|eukprot:XP_001638331.1 predicted protein [Nematostella vectensis]